MTAEPELQTLALVVFLTALMWAPYTLALIARGGLKAATGNRDNGLALPAWAERARRAHANAVENLALFAPAVLIASAQHPGSPLLQYAASTYLGARTVHYGVYAAGITVVRTLAFLVGWAALLAVLASVLT